MGQETKNLYIVTIVFGERDNEGWRKRKTVYVVDDSVLKAAEKLSRVLTTDEELFDIKLASENCYV